MGTTINFEIKKIYGLLTQEHRLDMLIYYMLNANMRNRTAPTLDELTKNVTGGNRNVASKTRQWLEDSGAIMLVPKSEYAQEEKKYVNRKIYQLTGQLIVDANGQKMTLPYLYFFTPQDYESAPAKPVKQIKIKPEFNREKRGQIFELLCENQKWDWKNLSEGNKAMMNARAKAIQQILDNDFPDFEVMGKGYTLQAALKFYKSKNPNGLPLQREDAFRVWLQNWQNYLDSNSKDLMSMPCKIDPECQLCGGDGLVGHNTRCTCNLPSIEDVLDLVDGEEKTARRLLSAHVRKLQAIIDERANS